MGPTFGAERGVVYAWYVPTGEVDTLRMLTLIEAVCGWLKSKRIW